MRIYRFYRMERKSTFQLSIETLHQIDEDIFINMLGMKNNENIPIYQLYGYDERIKCYVFINTNLDKTLLPDYLLWERSK